MDVIEREQCYLSLHSRNDDIAGHWYRALATTGFVAHSTQETRAHLAWFVQRAAALLLDETFDAAEAQRLGSDIAQLSYGHPDALSRTQSVLALELAEAIPTAQRSELLPRLIALISELGGGFIQRSRQIVLGEQESIREALLAARQQAQDAAQVSEARFRALVQNASDIVTILSADGTIVYQSPALLHVLGYTPEELVGVDAFNLVHPDDIKLVRKRFRDSLRHPGANVDVAFRFRHNDGTWRWLEATGVNLLAEPAVRGIVVNSRDVTEERDISERLWRQAHHDPLTGLANRVLFMDRLRQALERKHPAPIAVIAVDLDGFKVVNDSLGHEYGDRLLVAVTDRLTEHLGSRHLLARFGGDEFMILQRGVTERKQAIRMVRGLHAALAEPFLLDGHTLTVSASLGVVLPTSDLASPGDLLRAADVALNRAKADGKGSSATFDPDRDAPAFVRLHRETELRTALERGELRLHYQPQVHLSTGQVFGVEALVRWQHPTRGLLAPSAFIELAEDTGLIVPLGAWVIEEACRQVMSWRLQTPETGAIDLNVNVSPLQFREPALTGEIERILRDTRFPPGRLVLEITEQGLLEDTAATDRVITQLQALGVQLAIDDFGAYQAGLGYLRRWPIENLKLDRSLVAEIDRNERSRAIVSAVLALGEALGMRVIAEGIETAEQRAELIRLGCDAGQGYAFAPPLPPDALAAFVTSRNTTPS